MFYLPNILENSMSTTEKIIAVLRARGFLIDWIDNHYYVSDNASAADVIYLSIVMQKYELGIVVDSDDYKISTRRDWSSPKYSDSYTYKSLNPHAVEVIIAGNAKVDNAIRLFEDSEQIGFAICDMSYPWCQFATEHLSHKPDASCLESYVAYYVKAASACGVFTCFSCDGNHKNGGRIYVRSSYPSNIWHELLWEHVVCRAFGNVLYIEKGLKFSDAVSQGQAYRLVYAIADFLYLNRIAIRAIKEQSTSVLTNTFLKAHSKEEIELFYRQECEQILRREYNTIDAMIKNRSEKDVKL